MRPSRLVLALAALLLAGTAGRTAAQTVTAAADEAFAAYKAEVAAQLTAEDRRDMSDPLANADPFFWVLVDEAQRTAVIRLFEEARLSKQLGTSATGSGTTSIAVLGDSPTIFGLALEHGLVTGARTGETITFRGNPVGLLEAAAGEGFLESYENDRPAVRALRRVSFAASFDPSLGGEGHAVDPDADRLTAWSARVDVTNKRDPRDPAFRATWQALDATRRAEMQAASNEAMAFLWSEPAFVQWRTATLDAVEAAPPDRLERVLDERLAEFRGLVRSAATQAAVLRAVERTIDYLTVRQALAEHVLRTPLLVFEYTSQRPLDEPQTSDLRLIAEGPFFGGKIVGNAAAVLYDTIPAGAGRVKTLDAAVQWDLPLQYGADAGTSVLTLAARLQHLRHDVLFQDALVPDTSGTIGVLQLKVTVPIRDAALRIPISITWANRSELNQERSVRGQVGLTFDFDALIAGDLDVSP